MLNHIVNLLCRKGYQPFCDESGILVHETERMVYIVTLSILQKRIKQENYDNLRMRMEFLAASRYQKAVTTLHLVAAENGIFDEETMQLVEHLHNVWLLAADTGKIYIFENQSDQFDDLYQYLEQGVGEFLNKKKREQTFTFTPINMGIVVLNVFYFVFIILFSGSYSAVYDTDTMLKMGALSYETFMGGAWYQIITSLFMHFGFNHLLNNMILLTYTGCELEKRIGKFPYLIFYLVVGIVGNVVSLWYYHNIGEYAVSAGASGAIFGVIGALMVVLVVNHTETWNLTSKRLLIVAAITIYYGMTTIGIDNAAHIGGLICGIIGGFLLSKISQYGKLK